MYGRYVIESSKVNEQLVKTVKSDLHWMRRFGEFNNTYTKTIKNT